MSPVLSFWLYAFVFSMGFLGNLFASCCMGRQFQFRRIMTGWGLLLMFFP
jgi:hypothetical protein